MVKSFHTVRRSVDWQGVFLQEFWSICTKYAALTAGKHIAFSFVTVKTWK